MSTLIYFDNAATTRIKPECVYEELNSYLRNIGVSPGRGTYRLGIQASRMLYDTRKSVSEFFGAINLDQIFFTKSSTEAINLFVNGFLDSGDHVLLSCYEHNAVLRPIHYLSKIKSVQYSVINEDDLYSGDFSRINKYIKPQTKVVFLTLASNLTGQIVYSSELGECFHSKGILVFVDASQGAGKIPIDMSQDNIDYLAFTGHKDLYGLPGTGGLCCNKPFTGAPLIQGGTGINGDSFMNPDVYPESYEAGTLNMPALWALKAALDYTKTNRREHADIEHKLIATLLTGLLDMSKVTVYNAQRIRVPTLCFNVAGKRSDEVVKALDVNNICTRGGIHCAILAHQTLRTDKVGAVRVSLDYNNSVDEVMQFVRCINNMG